jgi:hypothetical protein
MAKIITAFMKDLIQQLSEEKISFSRMVELINEEVNKVEGNAKPMTAEEIELDKCIEWLRARIPLQNVYIDHVKFIMNHYANTKQVESREVTDEEIERWANELYADS